MNYLLIVIILGLGVGLYCMHEQDLAQISSLQQQVQELSAKNAAAATAATAAQPPRPTFSYPTSEPTPVASGQAIDAARTAAETSATGANLGTMTTLDGHSYTNCRLVKQEQDGVTFNHDDGITKVPYWNMSPDEQKEFGYDIHTAAATVEAQARYQSQKTTLSTSANP
jgi:hypothetical protein